MENKPIGRWGQIHRDYIKEHNPIQFNDLRLSGELWTYLADLNEQAQRRLEIIIEQMKASEGVVRDSLKNFGMATLSLRSVTLLSARSIKKLLELICRNEEKLKTTMTNEQKELFEKYTDCVHEYQSITDCLIFQSSFKLGAKMMVEIMEE